MGREHSTRSHGLLAVAGLLLGACGAGPGDEGPAESKPPQAQEAVPNAPGPVLKELDEEPGVYRSLRSARNSGHVAVGDVPASEGDEFTTSAEDTVKAQFRPDLVVGVDTLRSRAQKENWK
jgi:hypothetical protein